jgi:hypothetical protein
MPQSTLKFHYLDDRKLAQLAWLEFTRAMRTRRVIAFVGSMATEALGYPSWGALQRNYFEEAERIVSSLTSASDAAACDRDKKDALAQIKQIKSGNLASPVGMSLIGEVLESEALKRWRIAPAHQADWPLDVARGHLETLSARFAEQFRGPAAAISGYRKGTTARDRLKAVDVPDLLFDALDIRRFATTNYDFEIERKTMLRDREKWDAGENGKLNGPFEQLRAIRDSVVHAHAGEVFDWDLGSGRIRRLLTHGKAAESDLLNRERIDRLIEFAIGTDDVDSHVMHLHGRACDWNSMIVTQRDYDRLYRRNDLNRLPFEFARRLMMGGNPILFVGLGMGEGDLNRELQEFISNNRYHRTAPTFLLWSAIPHALTPDEIKRKRLDLLHRLGVLTIFDTDFALTPVQQARYDAAAKKRAALEQLRGSSKMKALIARASRIGGAAQDIRWTRDDMLTPADALETLADSVRAVARELDMPPREDHIGARWRNSRNMFERSGGGEHAALAILWKRADAAPPEAPSTTNAWSALGATLVKAAVPRWLRKAPPAVMRPAATHKAFAPGEKLLDLIDAKGFVCVLGPSGSGKGHASLALAEILSATGPCLLINGGFSFDTDSMLSGIAEFFSRFLSEAQRPQESRSAYFARLAQDSCLNARDPRTGPVERIYIVLNGAERFFSVTGAPLSAELDQLMQTDIARVSWVMFGSERARPHATTALRATVERFDDLYGDPAANTDRRSVPFVYMNDIVTHVSQRLDDKRAGRSVAETSSGDWRVLQSEIARFKALSAARISGDSQHMREAFYTWLLDGRVLSVLLSPGKDRVASRATITLAHATLRQLCFFGLPVERAVLEQVPALRPAAHPGAEAFDALLRRLVKLGLVLRLAGYSGYARGGADGHHRYALHRSLLTELRSRFAIPLSEAKLSTTFNMSLYVAQPVDGYIPEPAMHDELGSLMDALMSAYRADAPDPSKELQDVARKHKLGAAAFLGWLTDAASHAQSSEHPSRRTEAQVRLRIHRLCGSDTVQGLRATLAVARGFYSTTGILTLDNGDRLVRDDRDGILLEHAERLDRLIDMYAKVDLARTRLHASFQAAGHEAAFAAIYGSAEPFYAEELVWLHNERGAVRLAMGDLYEARASFDRALKVNRDHVEYTARDHNWRRIRLNQLTVEIEGGDIGLTRRMAEEIIAVSKEDKRLLAGRRHDPARRAPVRLREDRLAIAVATGHLAWCSHLQGDAEKAKAQYKDAIAALAKLEEVRAQAFFLRLAIDVDQSHEKPSRDEAAMASALDLVQSTRQMDLVHRFQVLHAESLFLDPDEEVRQKAYRLLDDALQYGLLADVYRVRCEAAMMIARLRHKTGDFEGALRFASDALMIATRYGMELRKIALRTDIARTMAARGHPVTARKLAKTAVTVASRQRFHTAITRAEEVLLEIPQISAAIGHSDSTGRRRF